MSFPGLWARRPRKGAASEMTFVPRYIHLTQQCFDRGALHIGEKISATAIREVIERLNPTRYDIPSAHHI